MDDQIIIDSTTIRIGDNPTPSMKGDRGARYDALVDAAIANPNQWVSAPSLGRNSQANSAVNASMAQRVCTVKQRGETVYLMFHGVANPDNPHRL